MTHPSRSTASKPPPSAAKGRVVPEFLIDRAALESIDETLHRLQTADLDDALRLRFDNHWAADGQPPALLGAALMSTLADRDLTVDVVDEDAVSRLLRSGVASALWRRARTTVFTPDADALDEPGLGATWTVGSRAVVDALFADIDPARPGAVGARHATFVNPHLSSSDDGPPDVVYLVTRWLTRRLGTAQANLISAVTDMLAELVANVHEHAGAGRTGVASMLHVTIDADAVRCSVSDTGVGICASLAGKLPGAPAPDVLLGRLLAGELDRWHHGRGAGLARVITLVGEHGGRLEVATQQLRAEATDVRSVTVGQAQFALHGTVVHCALPLPADA